MAIEDCTTVRVPTADLRRASALIERISAEKPGLLAASPGCGLTKSQIYRLAATYGLRQMEGAGVSFDGPVAGVGDETG